MVLMPILLKDAYFQSPILIGVQSFFGKLGRKVQFSKKNKTKLSREACEAFIEAYALLTTATNTLKNDNFRATKSMQNRAKKTIEHNKQMSLNKN